MERYRFTSEQQKLMEGMRQPFAVYQFIERKVVTLVLSDGFCRLFGYEDRGKAYYDMDHVMLKIAPFIEGRERRLLVGVRALENS